MRTLAARLHSKADDVHVSNSLVDLLSLANSKQHSSQVSIDVLVDRKGKVRALIGFSAKFPERSESVAMLDKRYGRGVTDDGEATKVQTPNREP